MGNRDGQKESCLWLGGSREVERGEGGGRMRREMEEGRREEGKEDEEGGEGGRGRRRRGRRERRVNVTSKHVNNHMTTVATPN